MGGSGKLSGIQEIAAGIAGGYEYNLRLSGFVVSAESSTLPGWHWEKRKYENPLFAFSLQNDNNEPNFTAANKALSQLTELKIVEQVGDAKRNRIFMAREVIELLNRPTEADRY